MLKPLRVLHTGLGGGRWNTAMSAALLRIRAADTSCDLVRFYRFSPSLLLGQTQDTAAAAAAQPCELEIARRVTGGGAVYMCASMLAWDFLTEGVDGRDRLSERVGVALASALVQMGWTGATFAPPNDITINGQKVSGAATASRGQAFLHQGTLLLRDERRPMAQALGVPFEILRDRLTCLDAHGTLPADEAIQTAFVAALARAFARAPVASALSPQERALAEEEFAAEIGGDSYVFGEVLTEGRHP